MERGDGNRQCLMCDHPVSWNVAMWTGLFPEARDSHPGHPANARAGSPVGHALQNLVENLLAVPDFLVAVENHLTLLVVLLHCPDPSFREGSSPELVLIGTVPSPLAGKSRHRGRHSHRTNW